MEEVSRINLGLVEAPTVDARAVLETLADGPLPDWSEIADAIRIVDLARGERLFRAGETHPYVYVVTRGLVKMLYETADGAVWLKGFATPGLCFASIAALAPGGRSSFAVEALAGATLARIPYAAIEPLAARHLAWQRMTARAFDIYGRRKEKRERELLTLSAEARYLGFLDEYREFIALIPQKDIASYIRVTPVALSRIKGRLRDPKRIVSA